MQPSVLQRHLHHRKRQSLLHLTGCLRKGLQVLRSLSGSCPVPQHLRLRVPGVHQAFRYLISQMLLWSPCCRMLYKVLHFPCTHGLLLCKPVWTASLPVLRILSRYSVRIPVPSLHRSSTVLPALSGLHSSGSLWSSGWSGWEPGLLPSQILHIHSFWMHCLQEAVPMHLCCKHWSSLCCHFHPAYSADNSYQILWRMPLHLLCPLPVPHRLPHHHFRWSLPVR